MIDRAKKSNWSLKKLSDGEIQKEYSDASYLKLRGHIKDPHLLIAAGASGKALKKQGYFTVRLTVILNTPILSDEKI